MLIVADNLQITNPAIAQAVETMDPEPVRDLVSRCAAAGAGAVDINTGPLARDAESRMTFLVETVESVTDLPLLLDTVNPAALRAGLDAAKNRVIINGFSLEPKKLEQILPLAVEYDVDIIGYLLYPDSQVPSGEAGRMQVAVELFTAFSAAGGDPARLIIDPVIAPVMWQNGTAQDTGVLSVIRGIGELLGTQVRTIAGISNLTTGPGPMDRKRLLERVYLSMLAAAGLDMALMNVFHRESVAVVHACNALLSDRIFTWEWREETRIAGP